MINIWTELQEVRKIIKFLKGQKSYTVDLCDGSGTFGILDDQGKVLYKPKNYEREQAMLYAAECHTEGKTPNAIDLNEYIYLDD